MLRLDQLIRQTRCGDGFRSDNGQVSAEPSGKVCKLANVLEVSGLAQGVRAIPSVARTTEDLLDRGALANLPRQSVLTPAGNR